MPQISGKNKGRRNGRGEGRGREIKGLTLHATLCKRESCREYSTFVLRAGVEGVEGVEKWGRGMKRASVVIRLNGV